MDQPFATVTEAAAFGYTVTLPDLVRASARIRTYLRSVRYPDTIESPRDDLIELTAQIASRLGSTPAQLAQGVQSQSAPGFAATYGWDAWKAQSGLTAGETATLKRMFPELPRTLSLGSPVAYGDDNE